MRACRGCTCQAAISFYKSSRHAYDPDAEISVRPTIYTDASEGYNEPTVCRRYCHCGRVIEAQARGRYRIRRNDHGIRVCVCVFVRTPMCVTPQKTERFSWESGRFCGTWHVHGAFKAPFFPNATRNSLGKLRPIVNGRHESRGLPNATCASCKCLSRADIGL